MSGRPDSPCSDDSAESTHFIDPASDYLRAYENAEQATYARGGAQSVRDITPPWYLFQVVCCCWCGGKVDGEAQGLLGESISARASPSSAAPCGVGSDRLLVNVTSVRRKPEGPEIIAHKMRVAGRAAMLVTAFLVAIAQWAALASGVRFFEDLVGLDENGASAASSAVLAVCFLSSIAGGILGDALWGNVKTLFVGLMGALASSAALALVTLPQLGWQHSTGAHIVISVAVFLFAISIGLCQTAIPSLVGEQCHSDPQLLQGFYNGYYALIQCGALIARVLFPLAHEQLDWFIALCLCVTTPTAIALFVFSLNSSVLAHRLPTEQVHAWRAFLIIVRRWFLCAPDDELQVRYGDVSLREAKSASSVLKLHAPLPIFWGLYFQMFVLWYLQAQQLDLVLFGSTAISAEQATALNPLFDVVLLIGIASLAAKSIRIEGTTKILLGYICATAAFGYGIGLQIYVTNRPPSTISVWWQLPQYLLLCAAEVLVYPAALHEVYTRSPATIRSFMQSCLWFFIGVGNTVNVIVLAADSKLGGDAAKDGAELTPLFIGYAGAMLMASMMYVYLMQQYRARMRILDDDCNVTGPPSTRQQGAFIDDESGGPRSSNECRSNKSIVTTTESLSMFSNTQDSQPRFGLPPLAAAATSTLSGPTTAASVNITEQRRIPISPRTSASNGAPVYHSTRRSPRPHSTS